MLPIHFAPLQGYTEDTYRRLHHELCGGVDVYYTPFVRIENNEVRSKDLRDLDPKHNEGMPLTPQIIASGEREMRQLLDVILPMGYSSIDINMGCPFPLQTRHARGAGILPHPERIEELCKGILSYPNVSFSIKMRLGLDSADEWREVLPILNEVPLRHITLHPRIGRQQYKGEADTTVLAEFIEKSAHPVIYNGDLCTLQQLHAIEHDFPSLAGLMLGRGLLARPTLAQEYKLDYEMAADERLQNVRRIHDRLLAHYDKVIPGEAQRLAKIRTFWDYMETELGRKPWKKIMKAGNMKNYLAAVAEAI